MVEKLKVNEIFGSINGEVCAWHQGSLCTFVRLQGCNLACGYCDTKKARDFSKGMTMTIPEIKREIKKIGNYNITITGGEPLLQRPNLDKLIEPLVLDGYHVSIETNGSLIPDVDRTIWGFVRYVMDHKGISSGESGQMCDEAFKTLRSCDILKFVVSSEEDFEFAIFKMKKLFGKSLEKIIPKIVFAPVYDDLDPKMLYELMTANKMLKKLGAILNLQIHKQIKIR